MRLNLLSLLNRSNFSLKAEGPSMLPIFQTDDVVYFKKTELNRIKINDIIVHKKNSQFISHRVTYKTNKYLVTKGDNNPESDSKIYSHQIIGKVVKVKRDGKEFDPNQIYLLQSSLYFQEIIKIKNAFEKAKIDFVFLKGLPLHLYFEKTHPKRIYADCDVLIDKKDFLKAEKILKKFGYKKTDEKNKQVENNYFKLIHGFSVIFDIHLEPAFLMTQFSGLEALYPQKLIDKFTEELLNNKQQIKINEEKFFILNTKYLILYLSLHLFHHNFSGAFRYQFLDMVIRIGLDSRRSLSPNGGGNDRSSEWKIIAQKIKEYRLGNFVYPVFVLLKIYYKTPFPRFFVLTMKQWNSETINIFDDQPRLRAGINRFKNIFFLSPNPWWKKIFVFTNPSVIYFIFWIIWKKLFSFFLVRRADRTNLS